MAKNISTFFVLQLYCQTVLGVIGVQGENSWSHSRLQTVGLLNKVDTVRATEPCYFMASSKAVKSGRQSIRTGLLDTFIELQNERVIKGNTSVLILLYFPLCSLVQTLDQRKHRISTQEADVTSNLGYQTQYFSPLFLY